MESRQGKTAQPCGILRCGVLVVIMSIVIRSKGVDLLTRRCETDTGRQVSSKEVAGFVEKMYPCKESWLWSFIRSLIRPLGIVLMCGR